MAAKHVTTVNWNGAHGHAWQMMAHASKDARRLDCPQDPDVHQLLVTNIRLILGYLLLAFMHSLLAARLHMLGGRWVLLAILHLVELCHLSVCVRLVIAPRLWGSSLLPCMVCVVSISWGQ